MNVRISQNILTPVHLYFYQGMELYVLKHVSTQRADLNVKLEGNGKEP